MSDGAVINAVHLSLVELRHQPSAVVLPIIDVHKLHYATHRLRPEGIWVASLLYSSYLLRNSNSLSFKKENPALVCGSHRIPACFSRFCKTALFLPSISPLFYLILIFLTL